MTWAEATPAPTAPGLRRSRERQAPPLWRLVDRVELQCRACGYGAVVRGDPPECPMCHANDWVPHRLPRLRSEGAEVAAVAR